MAKTKYIIFADKGCYDVHHKYDLTELDEYLTSQLNIREYQLYEYNDQEQRSRFIQLFLEDCYNLEVSDV